MFIQVNISGEESKHGFAEELDAVLPELTWTGNCWIDDRGKSGRVMTYLQLTN